MSLGNVEYMRDHGRYVTWRRVRGVSTVMQGLGDGSDWSELDVQESLTL